MMNPGEVEVFADNYYPPRQISTHTEEEDEDNASDRSSYTKNRVIKWVAVLFLLVAAIVLLVPLWQIALHQPNATTTSAATTADNGSSIGQDSTKKGDKGSEKDQGENPSHAAPSPSPLAHPSSAAPFAAVPLQPVSTNPDGSYPFVFPNTVRSCMQTDGNRLTTSPRNAKLLLAKAVALDHHRYVQLSKLNTIIILCFCVFSHAPLHRLELFKSFKEIRSKSVRSW